MHTCSSRRRGGCVRGDCGAPGAAGASQAGGSQGLGPRPSSPQYPAATRRQTPVYVLLFQIYGTYICFYYLCIRFRNYFWLLVTYNFYNSCMHFYVICICTHVAAAAEEVVYEVVEEAQEPQGQAPQQEDRGESAQGPTHPSVEQQAQGKPWCTSFYFKL